MENENVAPESQAAASQIEKKSSTLAMIGMILGIISVPTACVGGSLLGVAAIVIGIVALIQISNGKASGKGMAIASIATGVVGTFMIVFLLAGMLLPALNSAREKARRISCASNIKQIGLALKQYALDNKDALPSGQGVEGFKMLVNGGYLTDVKVFMCPTACGSSCAPAALTEESCSYVYLGSGLKDGDRPDIAVVLEKPGNHNAYGNILYLDGHVQGFAGNEWMSNAKKP